MGLLKSVLNKPMTSFGHQGRRRVFSEGPKFFKLCPIVSNYVQRIFPGGAKPPCAHLVTGRFCNVIVKHVVTNNLSANRKLWLLALNHKNKFREMAIDRSIVLLVSDVK